MLKLVLIALACLTIVNGASIEGNSTESAKSKRLFIQHGLVVPPIHPINLIYPTNDYYYSWYSTFPIQPVFTVVPAVTAVSACGACPSACPGTCGTWAGLNTCRLSTCPLVGNPCSQYNIARGCYLHPYSLDANRYIQCEPTPGVLYIRTCPIGLVYDRVFNVCSYPRGVVQYFTHFAQVHQVAYVHNVQHVHETVFGK